MSTFNITLANDEPFYTLRRSLRQATVRGMYLYEAYHTEDGLTPSEVLVTIATVLEEFDTI